MPKICTNVVVHIVQEVLDPVKKQIPQWKKKCVALPWWDPRRWLCGLVIVLTEVIEWTLRFILVPFATVICFFTSFVFGGILAPFAVAVDIFAPNAGAYSWVEETFWDGARVKEGEKVPSAVTPGLFDYHFTCRCSNLQTHNIVITIYEDDKWALELAKERCKKECG